MSTALGFVNSDRRADLVLTAGNRLAVVYGNQRHSTVSLTAMSPAKGFLIDAPDSGELSDVAFAGDMDGNGHADLLAGALGAPGGVNGASYLLYLP